MENARDALSLARIAGRVGFAGPTSTAFSPLLAGFFLALGRILRNLEQGFHALFKVLLGFLAFVIFVFLWHHLLSPASASKAFSGSGGITGWKNGVSGPSRHLQ